MTDQQELEDALVLAARWQDIRTEESYGPQGKNLGTLSRALLKLRERSATWHSPEEKDIARLREIEHMAWHVLEDSGEQPDGMVHIDGLSDDFRKLVTLLPEDHPGNDEAHSSPQKE